MATRLGQQVIRTHGRHLPTMRDMDGRVIHIPQDQSELHTSVPILGRLIFPRMFQVERGVFNVVTIREEENAPVDCQQHSSR